MWLFWVMQILRTIKHHEKSVIKVIYKSLQIFSILEIDISFIIIFWLIVPLFFAITLFFIVFFILHYSTLSQLPVHLQRSVQSNDNIPHWQSSPHKARRHLQVMSSNMCSGAGLHSIQTISNLPSLSCQPCLIGECGSKLVFKACFETSNW